MRNLYSVVLAVLITANTFAQFPQKMSYQAVVRNSSDQLVTNHAIGILISILKGSEEGTAVYEEIQTPTTNVNGLATIEIGGGTPIIGTFAEIDWSTGTYFIKTQTDPTGGTTYTITGTSQILSVPYAFYSKASESSADAVKVTGDQIIAGNKTFSDKIVGTLNANNTIVSNVANPINNGDAVNKAYVTLRVSATGDTLYLGSGQYVIINGISSANPPATIKDFDGNVYQTVKIGTQLWMKTNLKTTHYRDGSSIPNVVDGDAWVALTTGAYCWYNNDSTTYKNTFGAMYNFFSVVDNRQLCPTGWHVPTDLEWYTMENYLDSTINDPNADGYIGTDIGFKIKSTTGWNNGANGTDSTGLSLLPGSFRAPSGAFNAGLGVYGDYWTSTVDEPYAWGRYASVIVPAQLYRTFFGKVDGFYVRCIKN